MAFQKGLHEFNNKLGSSAGYSRKNDLSGKRIEKGKGGPSLAQFNSLPSMVNVRNNAYEFTPCNWYSKLKMVQISSIMTLRNGDLRNRIFKAMFKRIKIGPGLPGCRGLVFSTSFFLQDAFRIGTNDLKDCFGAPLIFDYALGDFRIGVNVMPFDVNEFIKWPRFASQMRMRAIMTEFANMACYAPGDPYFFSPGYLETGVSYATSPWYAKGSGNTNYEGLNCPQINFSGFLHGCVVIIFQIEFAQLNNGVYDILTGSSYASIVTHLLV